MVVTPAQALMAGTCLVHGKLGQFAGLEQRMVFGDGAFHRPVNFNPCGIQLPKRSATNTPHHHRIHGLAAEGNKWLALAVRVIEIPVPDRCCFSGFRINDNKGSGGSKMTEYHAIDTRILLGWKSYFHSRSPVVSPKLPAHP
jgi:hypothetical protein